MISMCERKTRKILMEAGKMTFPFLKNTPAFDKTKPLKAFSNICNDSTKEISFATQNFKQTLSSTKLSIVKCDK